MQTGFQRLAGRKDDGHQWVETWQFTAPGDCSCELEPYSKPYEYPAGNCEAGNGVALVQSGCYLLPQV